MKQMYYAMIALAGSSLPALAQSASNPPFWWRRPRVVSVPEIDASTGILAAAAVLAALALAWELRRRRTN